MAHHQEGANRVSAMQGILSMLRLSSRPNINSTDEDDLAGENDEPPDNMSPMKELPAPLYSTHSYSYTKTRPPPSDRKESLLTKALMSSPESVSFDHVAVSKLSIPKRGMSESSAGSNISASTADLTSDGGMTSPSRDHSPSPPTPQARFPTVLQLPTRKTTSVSIEAPARPQIRVADPHETAVEVNLGRKRCISFACGKAQEPKPAAKVEQKVEPPTDATVEPPKRKCALTFACSSKPTQTPATELKPPKTNRRLASPAPNRSRRSSSAHSTKKVTAVRRKIPEDLEKSEATRFHEFASSNDEDDEWVNDSPVYTNKITLDDCMKKENAIRKLGVEAEEEAMEEEDEDEEEDEEDEHIGFSDSDDDGNESDNEAGFADSDDESDAGSDYQFWTPGVTTAATSVNDEIRHIRPGPSARRTSETSIESYNGRYLNRNFISSSPATSKKIKIPRHPKARPATPELPDSTDFVCGTFDEDRPIEDAYISAIEQRRRSKHHIIPQDIDPSFPTTDPEDNDDIEEEDEAAEEDDDPEELHGTYRGRQNSQVKRVSPHMSPRRMQSPPPKPARVNRSPAPRRLFGQSPKRFHSPPPSRIQSPPCTRRTSLAGSPAPAAINIVALAQRPNLVHAKSLPRTPNPFFVQYKERSMQMSDANSLAGSPVDGAQPQELYTRGPIDIVRGLERKRMKRKEKFWRQHCKKAAKEHVDRKPQRGRGAERMRELGLEVAERTRGYGLGKPAELVLSI